MTSHSRERRKMITVKHRRATEDEWLESDPVIPDGELALVSRSGGYDVKIGDGVKKYSELSSLMGKREENLMDAYAEATLRHRDHACFAMLEGLNVTLLSDGHPDYVAMLSFTTDEYVDEFVINCDENITFSGASIVDGVFMPDMLTKYTMIFWRDAGMNCHVRGVYVG